MKRSRKRLCIVQPVMKSYRLPFFRLLQERLAADADIELQVAYGTPWARETLRGDNVDLEPPLGMRIESRMLFDRLLWIPAWQACRNADAAIVEHASKNLLNYPLAFARHFGWQKMAYWGHGHDRQADPNGRAERFKRQTLHWADWWFAYTSGAADYVENCGYASERITVVENAIDTSALRDDLDTIGDDERGAMVQALGLPTAGRRLVYCGSLYPNKRLDLLLDAADRVHAIHPDMQLIVIGGGPLADWMAAQVAARPWARHVGPRFGREKAVLLSLGQLWLNPGLVGLGILDAFCAGLPALTTDLPFHSPEIEYLEHGVNGLMLAPDAQAYADAVTALLSDPLQLEALRSGALASARRYSVETMAANFSQGVAEWLQP
jgi:glycosyltransferase involved in cell wall biosynthesis